MAIEWIVFDLGGVVIDVDFQEFFRFIPEKLREKAQREAGNIIQVFREYEVAAGALQPESVFDGIRDLLGDSLTDAQITLAVNAVLGNEKRDVCRIIEALAGNYQLACLSNTNHIHWDVLLQRYAVMNCFEVKMASHLLGCSKPDQKIYQLATEVLATTPELVLFFDDKLENVEAARRIGWNACVFEGYEGLSKDLQGFGIEEITNIRE